MTTLISERTPARTHERPVVSLPSHQLPSRSAGALLEAARHGVAAAAGAGTSAERYSLAHLAALRAGAAVLAARAQPVRATGRRGRPTPLWVLLPTVAPELSEWAQFFAAGATKRARAESGVPHAVTEREADDLLRDAETFLALVETTLGLTHQPSFPDSRTTGTAQPAAQPAGQPAAQPAVQSAGQSAGQPAGQPGQRPHVPSTRAG